jgi:predicted DNA-binding transcriptional regulator YafY
MVTGYVTNVEIGVSRTERLLELITRVRVKGRFTVQEMADEFGVSRRTMLRDLHALSAMGVPLAAVPGPGGGYTLPYPQRPVTLSFSADEALGLILSYEALPRDAPSPFRAPSVSAITKLRGALAPDVVRDLDRLRERVAVVGIARTYDAPFLADLLQAARDEVHLRIGYDSRRGHSERLIFPYGLVAGLGFWYCACYDYRRGIHAWLRADRMRSLERVDALEPPEVLTLPEWLRRPREADPDALHLRAAVTARGMKELDWSAFGDALVQETDGSGRIDMAIPVSSLNFYARLFLRLGREATIASPPELIAVLRWEAHAILSLYPP